MKKTCTANEELVSVQVKMGHSRLPDFFSLSITSIPERGDTLVDRMLHAQPIVHFFSVLPSQLGWLYTGGREHLGHQNKKMRTTFVSDYSSSERYASWVVVIVVVVVSVVVVLMVAMVVVVVGIVLVVAIQS